jgi:glycosyltransferase involved in cell wall biosynthesis
MRIQQPPSYEMKIAIVTQFPNDPQSPRGGVEAVSVNLVAALAAYADLEVHVVTVDRVQRSIAVSRWQSATIHRLPYLGGSTLGNAMGRGRRQVSEYVSDLHPDVIHAHDTYGLMVQGLRIPRVFTIHGFIYADTMVSGQRLASLRSRLWKWCETRGWADQDYIISISPYVRERLAGIAGGVIHDVDNPVSPELFEVRRAERRGVIFSAAVIEPRKNTLGLVEVVKKLVDQGLDVELRLAGAFTNARYVQRVERRIRELSLAENVFLLGNITKDHVRCELAESSIFALLSLEENSPMGIEEAMAVGVPVVASNRCGMPYMVRHGETGFLVDPNDTATAARYLLQLVVDEDLRRRMGERSREAARDRFHPAEVARRTRTIYYEAAGALIGTGASYASA